jgi:hypothetical protein
MAKARHIEDESVIDLPDAIPKTMRNRNCEGLASDLADALFEVSRGDIWMGNGNGWQERGGVAKWEHKTNHLRVFSKADGLPPRVDPTTFAEDAAGDIWIGHRYA